MKEHINSYGFKNSITHRISKGKPVIRIKNIAGIRYRYTHVRGDLNPIIVSDRIFGLGYVVELSIGLQLYQPFA